MASRGSSSLPPAGWHSTAPRRMPSKRYRSAAVKSASDPGLCGTGNALGSGVATARGVATGGTDGAAWRSAGDGEGPMLEAPHAATATAATSDATRMSRDIFLISEVLAVDEAAASQRRRLRPRIRLGGTSTDRSAERTHVGPFSLLDAR